MKTRSAIFLIFLMNIMTMSLLAESKKKDVELTVNRDGFEYECHQENCLKDLPNLVFNEVSERHDALTFSAKFVAKEGDSLVFINPRIDKYLISHESTVCVRYKKNIFGYDICQELKKVDIRDSICRMLGLVNSDNSTEHALLSYNSFSHPFLYQYSKDQDYWMSLRLGSVLLPSTNFLAINKLKCQLL